MYILLWLSYTNVLTPIKMHYNIVGVIMCINLHDCLCMQDGADLNVGNPLAKNYLHLMENGTLTSAAGHLGQRILTLNSMTAFWRSSRQRIM